MPRHYSPRWLTRKRGTSRQKGKRFPVKPRRHIKVASVLDSQQQMLAPRTPTKPKLPSDAQIIMEVEKLQKQRNFAFIPRSEIFKGFPDCDSLAVAERINALVKSGKLEETTKPYGKLGYVGLPTKPFPSSAHFPYGDVKEKDAKYKGKAILPKEFWDKRESMAEWKKEDAEKLYCELKPFEGQYVILYGGGMMATGESWIGKLEKVELGHPTYYDKPQPYQAKDKYIVTVHLSTGKMGTKMPGSREEFEPRLGSWKIEQIVPEEPLEGFANEKVLPLYSGDPFPITRGELDQMRGSLALARQQSRYKRSVEREAELFVQRQRMKKQTSAPSQDELKSVYRAIYNRTKKHGWARRDELVAKGYSEVAINEMLRSGRIYEPREGFLKPT